MFSLPFLPICVGNLQATKDTCREASLPARSLVRSFAAPDPNQTAASCQRNCWRSSRASCSLSFFLRLLHFTFPTNLVSPRVFLFERVQACSFFPFPSLFSATKLSVVRFTPTPIQFYDYLLQPAGISSSFPHFFLSFSADEIYFIVLLCT